MATESELATLKVIRTRLLTFTPSGGSSGAALLGTGPGAASDGKLHIDQAPDNVTFPYGVMRFVDWTPEGEDGGYAHRGQLECQLFHRPRGEASAIKTIADQFERALRKWVYTTSGIIVIQSVTRGSITYEAPADRELVQERLLASLYAHPQYLTQDSA